MREGCAPCRPPATLGRVPPGRVCMADCIKHKQLYLIGLYPALITTNSQSLWTALFAPATLQDKQGKSHSSAILRTKSHKNRDDGGEGAVTIQIPEHMQFTFSPSVRSPAVIYGDDGDYNRTQFIITVVVTIALPEGEGKLNWLISFVMY